MQTAVSLSLSHRVNLPVTSLIQTAVSLSLSHLVTPVTSLMQTAVSLSLSHRKFTSHLTNADSCQSKFITLCHFTV